MRLRFLTTDRRGPVAYRACTSTSRGMCTVSPCPCARAEAPHVAARVTVVPRPHERRYRSGECGRGGSDPTLRVPGTARRGLECALPFHPSPGVTPGPSIPCGKIKRRAGTGASRSWSAMPDSPTARWSGNGSLSASKRLLTPFRDGLLAGSDPQRRGGWGCPAPSPLAPIEALPRWGSLPATCRERGSTSALRWPWRNRQRASDMRDQSRVRPNDHFVSGDPQSEPDTQDLPPTPAPGAQNRTPEKRRERRVAWMSVLVDPAARRLPEDAPEPAETASEASMGERRLRNTRSALLIDLPRFHERLVPGVDGV